MNGRLCRWTACTFAAAALAGCVTPDATSPSSRRLSVTDLSGSSSPTVTVTWPADDWWRKIGSDELASLVERALAQNPSLDAAQARLARARAGAAFAGANRLPQAGLGIDAHRQLYTQTGLYPPPVAGAVYNDASAFLSASWELDFFGKHRAALDAALGQQHAAQAEVQAARVLVASLVARTWFQLAWLLDDRELAGRIRANRTHLRDLVAERARAGLDSRTELRPIEAAAADANLAIEALDERIALARNSLAALTVQPLEAMTGLRPRLTARAPAATGADVPADLVGRRADVVAARWRVEASLHDRDSARAQFYPNVSLGGLLGLTSIGLDRLAHAPSETWAVGPALRLPVFDAGRLRANYSARTADADAAIASYNATVLDAVRDAADRIASTRALLRQQAEQDAARRAADDALSLARERHAAGLTTTIAVLAAELPALAQRRVATELAARTIDNDIALIRALGGGYTEPAR